MNRRTTLALALIADIACWSALFLVIFMFLPSCAKVPQGTVIAVSDEMVVEYITPVVVGVPEEMTAIEFILE